MFFISQGRSAARCGNQFAIGENCESGKPTDPCLESKEHRDDARELCDIISDENGKEIHSWSCCIVCI